MKRRKFLKKSFYTFFGIGLLTGFYSWQIEPFLLEFVKLKMPIKNLPNHLKGKTVMQISDIHVGNRVSSKYLKESLQKAQQYKPDFVVYTGDFVHYESPEQLEQLKDVLQYVVKGNIATIGVLGNHDYGKDWKESKVADEIESILTNHHIQILRNTKKEIEGLQFIGIDDYWGTNFYPNQVMNQLDKEKPSICLCHNPDVCDLAIWNNFEGWILSGHTHGGQVKPPFLDPPILPVKNKRYSSGKIPLSNNRILYINRALGYLHQVRLNVKPEITLFELA
ncbi:metallophosphoesterase [Polaribacter marinivivus]|uniref:Metallophosphoesterase n=1 Tax=Polaribacter marinivivus TaxID=1524260 RepID=A0ABV8RB78_9FLAO